MKRLGIEIQQKRPFESLEAEALLNLERTSDQMRRLMQQTLKPHGLTAAQYNVLRILRGAEPDGLPYSEIGKRMISADPDITRLLGRLERLRLTDHRRTLKDKRIRYARITRAGLQQLKKLDPMVRKGTRKAIGHMPPEKLTLLIDLLEEARGSEDPQAMAMPVTEHSK